MTDTASARHRALAAFRARFGRTPQMLIRSPGRVNLIGEHTDYNDGFVLPLAIEAALWLAATPQQGRVTVVSDDIDGEVDLHVDDVGARRTGWGAYVQGVLWAMVEADESRSPFAGAIASDVPAGAGLSSSAALEMAIARALTGDGPWDPVRAARLGQRAENEWVGVESGIMDQLASAAARSDHALLIDCRSLTIDHVPLPSDVRVVVMDTATRRELTTSEYNARRRECAAAARALGVPALRDADAEAVEGLDDPMLRRRARHVVTEHARTAAAAQALRDGDVDAFGRLMGEAHASMRDDFEASSVELDAIVDAATAADGCIGARMTGGGFGGSAVALVRRSLVDEFSRQVSARYAATSGHTPRLHVTAAAAGTARCTV